MEQRNGTCSSPTVSGAYWIKFLEVVLLTFKYFKNCICGFIFGYP